MTPMTTTARLLPLALIVCAAPALADVTLSGFATCDNLFSASISLSPTDPGTPWFNGDNWQQMYNSSTNLTAAGLYYLQVRCQDLGQPEMFIASFALAGPGAVFANGTQTLKTNTLDWVVSTTGFGQNTTAPALLGPNGTGPWGTAASVQDAQYIWAPVYDQGIAYFTASFTIIPAPAAGTLVLGGGGLIAVRRRRR